VEETTRQLLDDDGEEEEDKLGSTVSPSSSPLASADASFNAFSEGKRDNTSTSTNDVSYTVFSVEKRDAQSSSLGSSDGNRV
jgi:hypothetical protein